MKYPLDKFSTQSEAYQKFRPTYPLPVYEKILPHVKNKDICWDCGTGNGQVASVLAEHFKTVHATDISANQLARAAKKDNITYSVQRAEQTAFPANTFDLVTAAQAAHWFDMVAFNQEVQRVGKTGGIVSIWGYGLMRIETEVDAITDDFYQNKIGPYWNAERRHIDAHYASLPFDFEEIPITRPHQIEVYWTLAHVRGYLSSWSSVQNYKQRHEDNPVDWVMKKLEKVWPAETVKRVVFPVFMKMGRI